MPAANNVYQIIAPYREDATLDIPAVAVHLAFARKFIFELSEQCPRFQAS